MLGQLQRKLWCHGNPGRTKLYTKADAIGDWELIVSPDDVSVFDDAKRTLDDWKCLDYTQLYLLTRTKCFIVAPARCALPSDAEEVLPYNQLSAAFCRASARSDDPYDQNWIMPIYKRHYPHGKISVPSRPLFEGHAEAGDKAISCPTANVARKQQRGYLEEQDPTTEEVYFREGFANETRVS